MDPFSLAIIIIHSACIVLLWLSIGACYYIVNKVRHSFFAKVSKTSAVLITGAVALIIYFVLFQFLFPNFLTTF